MNAQINRPAAAGQLKPHPPSVRLYNGYAVLAGAYFWMPLFVLYFSSIVSLRQVFLLESIYYGTVFLLEVPSGYFSDAAGRRRTLLLSALFFIIAYTMFFIGTGFAVLAVGQAFLAAGFAFASGTDTSLHLALLTDAGREEEYGPREARLASLGLIVSAAAALTGGTLAWLARYRTAYALSFVCALASLLVLLCIPDPDSRRRSAASGDSISPLRQGRRVLAALKNRKLRYLFTAMVLITVLNHVPYEFYQLYVRNLINRITAQTQTQGLPASTVPLITGFHAALTMLTASWFARRAVRFRDSIGTKALLITLAALQTALIMLLATDGRIAVVLLLLLRSVPGTVSSPVMRAEAAPAVPPSLRATYLSFQSLAGRLAFALVLFAFSRLPGSEYRSSILLAASIGIFTLLLLAVMRRGPRSSGTPGTPAPPP